MLFEDLRQDLRYALRTLRRDAGFATFALLIVGLGVGAATTVFSVVNTLILRPLPFADPQQLVWIANRDTSGLSGQTTQVGHMLDLREQTQSLSAIAGYFAFYGVGDNLLSGTGEPERLSGVPVSDNFFDVLGVRPLFGRTFNAQECAWNGPKAVLLGHGLWQRRFAADPAIVGTTLTLNDKPHTVVGVLPASFDFGSVFAPGGHFDLYFPFPLSQETNRWGNTMAMIGRLKPGASAESARAEIRTLAGQITAEHPERNSLQGHVKPLAEQVSGRVRPAVWVLAGAVAMVILIVCANLSNLLLARTATRQKEIAIRTALGAGRRRLVVQMLTEGIVLSCSGALLGLLLAVGGTRGLARLDAVSIPLLRDVQVDLDGARLHAGDRGRDGHRLRSGAGVSGSRGGARQRAEGLYARIHGGPAAQLGAERTGCLGDCVRLRAAGRCGPPHPQPHPSARRRHGIRGGAGGDDSRRSRQPLCDARTTDRVFRRSAAPRQGDPRGGARGDHGCAAARP